MTVRRLIGAVLAAALISGCSQGSGLAPSSQSVSNSNVDFQEKSAELESATTAYPLAAQRSLPQGTTVDAFNQLHDSLDRDLIWDIPDQKWVVDVRGMFIDATEAAPTASELRGEAAAFAALVTTAHVTSYRSVETACVNNCGVTLYASGGDAYVQYASYRYTQTNDVPPLHLGSDGNYYDDQGNQWAYSGSAWVKTIGTTVSAPPNPFSTTYNFINGLAPWFYGAAVGGVLAAYIPFGALAAHITSRGAGWFTYLAVLRVRQVLAASSVTVVPLEQQAANSTFSTQYGYSTPPWAGPVFQFASPASMSAGSIAGQQLVRVGSTAASASGGPWLTAQSSIAGMSSAEIGDLLSLPSSPSFISNVQSIPTGTTMYVGTAAPAFGGTGGGIQFFAAGPVTFGAAVPLP